MDFYVDKHEALRAVQKSGFCDDISAWASLRAHFRGKTVELSVNELNGVFLLNGIVDGRKQ